MFFYDQVVFHSVKVPQFFIHSSTDGDLGCFQTLEIVDNAAMNIQMHLFFQIGISVFLGYIPRSGISGSKGSSTFNLWKEHSKVGIKGAYCNVVKTIYEKPTANIILNGQNLKVFSLRKEEDK